MLINELNSKYQEMWEETSSDFPGLNKKSNAAGRLVNEWRINRFRKELNKMVKTMPADKVKQHLLNEKICSMVGDLESNISGYENNVIDYFSFHGYANITETFIEDARTFDPELNICDIFQAMRNVWIMNSIQLLFDRDVKLTPSIFSYSMLYPYSDNYLDDPYISIREKKTFNYRFHESLMGNPVDASNDLEELIFRLVGKIEDEYSRVEHPNVFNSLLAIHAAQSKSVSLQNVENGTNQYDIVSITFEKGGTSVLADGFLVKPDLTIKEADYLYSFGVFLQLIDDLQDVAEDMHNGHMTIFSRVAADSLLDQQTSKLFRFIETAQNREDIFTSENSQHLKKIMQTSCEMMVIEAISRNKELFSDSYLRQMERYSLVRLAYYQKLKRRFQLQYSEKAISNLFTSLAFQN